MNYITIAEFITYIRDMESADQSNEESEWLVAQAFYTAAIETASNELDSRLGLRFATPLPLSPHVKSLCYPIAHWWAEKQGVKREYIQVEYDRTIELIKEIAAGSAALIGIDGSPVGAIGGDTSPLPGLQGVGVYVGQRLTDWRP